MTVANRLKELMEKGNVSAYALANATDLNQPTITRILNGESKQPKKANLDALAKYFGVSTEWLMFGGGEKYLMKNQVDFFQQIPLISTVQAGGWGQLQELESEDVIEWIRSSRPKRSNTFALRVQGDSMSPMFQDGSIVIVEPDEALKHGSYVIAKCNNDTEVTFKQYAVDAGRAYLRPLNTQYPTLEIKEDCRIIGIVVESVTRFV